MSRVPLFYIFNRTLVELQRTNLISTSEGELGVQYTVRLESESRVDGGGRRPDVITGHHSFLQPFFRPT